MIKKSSLCGIGLGLLPEFAIRKELIYHMAEKINHISELNGVSVYTQLLMHQDKWISPDLEQFLAVAARHFI